MENWRVVFSSGWLRSREKKPQSSVLSRLNDGNSSHTVLTTAEPFTAHDCGPVPVPRV